MAERTIQVELENDTASFEYALAAEASHVSTDTFDATAHEDDILIGKTAYARGEKITGTSLAVVLPVATGVYF